MKRNRFIFFIGIVGIVLGGYCIFRAFSINKGASLEKGASAGTSENQEGSADNLKQVMDNYQQSIALNPKDPELHYKLADVYARLGLISKAKQHYLEAIALNPKHMDAMVNLSLLSYLEKNFDDAVKYCDDAMKLGYNPPEDYLESLKKYRQKEK